MKQKLQTLLIALAAMLMLPLNLWADGVGYKTVEMLSEIPIGKTFLLSGDPDGNQFLTTDGANNLTTRPYDNSLIIFEATGTKTESGFNLYAIKFAATGEYIADQVIADGMDSSDMLNYHLPYFTTTTDLGRAAKWTILPAATRYMVNKDEEGWEENWRTYTGQGNTEESTGNMYPYEGAFVIMRDKLTDGNGSTPVYLESQSDYTMFAPWGNNDWFLFSYEEKSAADLLQEWWNTNYPEGTDALMEAVGDKVGQYTEESVAVLLAAYEAYRNWLIEGVGDAEEILAESKAAHNTLKVNPMKEGYYYIVSKRGHWAAYDDYSVMRGHRDFNVPVDKETGETTVTLESSKYIWLLTLVENKENTYIVKNYVTSRYVTTSAHDDRTGIKTGELAKAVDYTVANHLNYPGTVMLYNLNDKGEMTCAWNIFSTFPNSDVIGNWMNDGHPENDEGNFFHLYNVADEKVAAIAGSVKQYEINTRLQKLYDNAVYSYQRGLTYEPEAACTKDDNFSNHGYLWYEKDERGEPVYNDDNLLVTNIKAVANDGADAIVYDDGEALLGFLDDNVVTYTHTKWIGTSFPHFFEIDLGEGNELDAIAIKMMRRQHQVISNANYGFGEVKVFGRNSEEEEWTAAGNLVMSYNINLYEHEEDGSISVDEEGNPILLEWSSNLGSTHKGENYIGIGSCGLGASYRYLRLQHYKAINEIQDTYFSAAEFALFGATYAPEKSLNGVIPANILDTFVAEMAKAKAELAVGKGTETQIAALQAAYNEFLVNFPEPRLLTNALNAAKTIAKNLPVDNVAVGYYPQTALDTYNAVIAEVESTVADVMTVETIKTGVAKLDAAKVELLNSLNMFASGFYQVKIGGGPHEEALMHASRTAIDTKDVKGLRAEFAKQTGNIDEGLVDDENYINKVSSVWHFEVGEGNKVAIRSLANGLYLQPVLSNVNFAQMTPEKAWLEVQADGLKNGGLYNIILGNDTTTATKGRPLYANINTDRWRQNGELVSWYGADGGDGSTLKFEEVDLADFIYGQNTFVLGTNKTQFFTLPYDAVMYGQSAKVCEVEGYFEDPETGEKAIYFKNIQEDGAVMKAGQAYLVQTDYETDFLTVELENETITGFDNFNYVYEGKEVNGLLGTIFSQTVGPDFGVLNIAGNSLVDTKNGEENGEVIETLIAPLSGYINPANLPVLKSAPEGNEYVKILNYLSFDFPEQPEVPEEPGESEYIELVEGTNFANGMTREVAQVSYNRTLPNLKWNALYLPVEIPVSELRDNYDVAYFNNMHAYDRNNDGTVDEMDMEIFFITEGTLHANHPYFIRAKNNAAKQMNLVLTDVTLHSTEAANCTSITTSSAYMNFELKGVYKRIYVSNTNIPVNPNPEAPISNDYDSDESIYGCYAITASGAWSPIAVGSYLNPFRLYLKMTDRDGTPVKMDQALQTIRIRVHGEDGTTDIEEHCINGQQSTTIYDLQGRRVVNPAKGIYIVNGKKVMIK